MAEVPITINGVICDLYGRTIMGPVKVVGSMMRSDLSVGGGPIIGGGDKPPGQPPTIWPGPGDPDFPGGGGPPGGGAPPSDPTVVKPPPASGGWGWVPDYGWGYFPGPGEAEPKK